MKKILMVPKIAQTETRVGDVLRPRN